MAELTKEMTDEIQKLDRHCAAMLEEEKKKKEVQDTELSYLRRAELRNIRNFLLGVLEDPEIFAEEELKRMLKDIRSRVRELKFNPESAGQHSHALKKKT